ncbi:MAG: signal peptide peptidase SppA [Bacteroidales bacterium]|jgi:protease-4|nr:signal peptide peptidase SppA [Bacteroidales bacterium]
MKKFFGTMFASFFGMVLFVAVSIFLLIIIVAGSISSSDVETKLKDNSVLEIKLSQPIADNPDEDIMANFNPLSGKTEKSVSLKNVIHAVCKASKDDKIKGIVIDAGFAESQSIATMQELRTALQHFKDSSDKFIYAYGEAYSQTGYYLASIADKIYVQSEGGVEIKGINFRLQFFKKLLDKAGVEMQIIRHGKFKSAVEPFTEEKMSEANREQYKLFANSLWSEMVKGIADGRKITEARVNEIADSLLTHINSRLISENIIDGFMERSYFNDTILKDMHLVSVGKYKSSIGKEKNEPKDRIAIIYAQGDVGTGKGSVSEIGMENISSAIKKAADNKKVKAIVLRVNSPGGSVLTSDIIYRAVVEAKAKKPVVASFGTYAASGGYYISCAANKIYSDATTLTGSIGVFGMIPNAQKLLNDKVGITFDEVGTNKNSGYGTVVRSMQDYERDVTQQGVEDIYFGFVQKVAQGRGKTVEYIDSIGQGRVWAGVDALKIGLVDELGGLTEAIKGAAELAGISEYKISEYPEPKDQMTQLMELLGQSPSTKVEKEFARIFGIEGASMYKVLQQVQQASETQVYARLPFGISVE